jgi:hypothetical protein
VIAVSDHFVGRTDIRPVVVTFATATARLAEYRAHLGLDVPVLSDADRRLYGLLGAARGTLPQVWNPGTLTMYARLMLRGRRLARPREDTRQLGADAFVDATGRLRRRWLPASPDARPSIDELDAAIADAS